MIKPKREKMASHWTSPSKYCPNCANDYYADSEHEGMSVIVCVHCFQIFDGIGDWVSREEVEGDAHDD